MLTLRKTSTKRRITPSMMLAMLRISPSAGSGGTRYTMLAASDSANMPRKNQKGKPRLGSGLYRALKFRSVSRLNLSSMIYAMCSSFFSKAKSLAVCPLLFRIDLSQPAISSHLTMRAEPAMTARCSGVAPWTCYWPSISAPQAMRAATAFSEAE